MTIQFGDDFSRYGVGAGSTAFMLDGLPYANIGTGGSSGRVTLSPDPNEPTVRAFKIGFDGNNWPQDTRIALPSVVTGTVGVLCRAWLANLPNSAAERCALFGTQAGNGSYLAYMQIEQNGSITVIGKVAGVLTQIADSVNPIVQPGTFNHFEFIHDNALGEGEIWVNGVLRLSFDGVDTGTNIEFVNITNRSAATTGPDTWIKDLVIWDSSGTQNNSQMGTVLVRRLNPDGDNTLGGWVPSVGTTGFNLLAKDTPDDSTYLSADDTPPASMKFTLEDLPPDVTSVRGLISVTRSRKVDGGDAFVQTALTPNDVDFDNGTDRPITSAFTYYFDVSELDPASATAWSPSAVDDVLQEIDRTL